MTTTTIAVTDHLDERIDAFAQRMFGLGLASFQAGTIALGRRLGLYATLDAHGPCTPSELAKAAGIDARYAREWLEQQAVSGFVEVDDVDAPPQDRLFHLSPEAVATLTDPDSPAAVGAILDAVASVGAIIGPLAAAYRAGEGFAYADYPDISRIQGDFNRPMLRHQLTQAWLPAVPGLVERLAKGARAVEFGCGEGWAAIALAKAFPALTVDAYDVHEPSIAAARHHAAVEGVDDRVRFVVADVSRNIAATGDYDLVLAVEMIHDLARPVETLTAARGLVAPGGFVLVIDERAEERFDAPAPDSLDAFLYCVSVLHCLPVGRSEATSAGTGTVMRPALLHEYATQAGFAGVDVLPIEHEFFRFYLLRH